MEHALTKYRKRRGMTLDAFGALVGATKGMISKWETGKAVPRRHFIERIVAVTNGEVSAADLMLLQANEGSR